MVDFNRFFFIIDSYCKLKDIGYLNIIIGKFDEMFKWI